MKQTDHIALKEWQEFHKAYAADVPVDNSLSRYDIERRRKQLEADPVA